MEALIMISVLDEAAGTKGTLVPYGIPAKAGNLGWAWNTVSSVAFKQHDLDASPCFGR